VSLYPSVVFTEWHNVMVNSDESSKGVNLGTGSDVTRKQT